MTIIIEHYPCRHPAMTALIRGAFKTDPSKAQPPRNTAVNTPLGGGANPGPHSPSKLLLIRPEGKALTTLFLKEPSSLQPSSPSLPLSPSLSLPLSPLSLHPCLRFIKLIYTQEGHLHKLRRINKRVDLWIIRCLSMKAKAKKKKRCFCRLVTSDRC